MAETDKGELAGEGREPERALGPGFYWVLLGTNIEPTVAWWGESYLGTNLWHFSGSEDTEYMNKDPVKVVSTRLEPPK